MNINSKRSRSTQSGFTLIELLVVIAIIGILASIILASLATARSKGVDATTKSDLNSVNSQMELFNQGGTTGYTGGCAAVASATPPGASTMLAGAQANANASFSAGGTFNAVVSTVPATYNAVAGTYNSVTCHDSGTAWAAEAPLSASRSGATVMWCVDSNGNAKQETNINLAANATVCT